MAASSRTTTIALATALTITAITTIATLLQLQKLRKEKYDEEKHNNNDENKPIIQVILPDWLYQYYEDHKNDIIKTDEDMMTIAIEISRLNSIVYKMGGPFGCAIYQRNIKTDVIQLYSVGCNCVVSLNNSTLHGEMVAIQFAQYKLQHYKCTSLCPDADIEYILVTSCEPCCMCLGGTLWSGVSTLITGATKYDAELIGFHEGPVNAESYHYLINIAKMNVKRNVLRTEAAAVLLEYGKIGVIY